MTDYVVIVQRSANVSALKRWDSFYEVIARNMSTAITIVNAKLYEEYGEKSIGVDIVYIYEVSDKHTLKNLHKLINKSELIDSYFTENFKSWRKLNGYNLDNMTYPELWAMEKLFRETQ